MSAIGWIGVAPFVPGAYQERRLSDPFVDGVARRRREERAVLSRGRGTELLQQAWSRPPQRSGEDEALLAAYRAGRAEALAVVGRAERSSRLARIRSERDALLEEIARGAGHPAGRARGPAGPVPRRAEIIRMYPVEDMHIIRSGDGRTVEAYAAVFDDPAEIRDHEGHYTEEIDPGAFRSALAAASRGRGGLPGAVKVLFNHGCDLTGAPSDRYSMPIGVPVEIRPDSRGLLTRTRYSETPLADEVLENIRNGSITAQSFVGRIIQSTPELPAGMRHRPDRSGQLPTVRRTQLGLREYGPVLWPAYKGAEIVGVRGLAEAL